MASAFFLGCPISFASITQPILKPRNPFLLHIPCNRGRQFQTHRQYLNTRPIANATDNSTSDHNRNKKYFKPVKIAAGASLALACALSIFGCKLKHLNPKAAVAQPSAADMMISGKPPVESMYEADVYPFPGKTALQSLFDVSAMLASDKPVRTKGSFHLQKLPHRLSPEDVYKIKMEAVRLMKAGKPEDAVQLLRDASWRYRNEPESEFNLQLALVEILILLGRYEEAQDYDCISDDNGLQPSDVRIPLYKAIVFTMVDENERAKIWWEKFIETIGEGIDPDSYEG